MALENGKASTPAPATDALLLQSQSLDECLQVR